MPSLCAEGVCNGMLTCNGDLFLILFFAFPSLLSFTTVRIYCVTNAISSVSPFPSVGSARFIFMWVSYVGVTLMTCFTLFEKMGLLARCDPKIQPTNLVFGKFSCSTFFWTVVLLSDRTLCCVWLGLCWIRMC